MKVLIFGVAPKGFPLLPYTGETIKPTDNDFRRGLFSGLFGNSNEYVVRKLSCVFEFSEFKKFFLTFLIYLILIG